ncbi:tobramycin N-acetyltransferase AAC(6')-III [Burkholderia mayonis]|uniref:Aminoglycoside N(6')-acetyltransferase type 1 n=1 Tax=Burkholderia mayonis TaxID=1385591 RepID=A0A1B4FVQ1_9BURK|nr:tobramycin N-acetyltransferase AAC(6')-III [Burkholderia mayonis]AOJ07742.1 aminoglycoside 6'-acetyltransferase [Burkholderia mayonis]KVE50305.1 aminoglycoside 6'-acetyltransferase [Burkholderia mayonis]
MTHPASLFTIRAAAASDALAWRQLRRALWPHADDAEHARDVAQQLDAPYRHACFIAWTPDGAPLGFAEVAVRRDYVNGCDTSPVLFLEGIFVDPAARRRGVARALCSAAAVWGATCGCAEFASDAPLGNAASHALHRALGFDETERVVFFRKTLAR